MDEAVINIKGLKFNTFFQVFKTEKDWEVYERYYLFGVGHSWKMKNSPEKYPCMILKDDWNMMTNEVTNIFLYLC